MHCVIIIYKGKGIDFSLNLSRKFSYTLKISWWSITDMNLFKVILMIPSEDNLNFYVRKCFTRVLMTYIYYFIFFNRFPLLFSHFPKIVTSTPSLYLLKFISSSFYINWSKKRENKTEILRWLSSKRCWQWW